LTGRRMAGNRIGAARVFTSCRKEEKESQGGEVGDPACPMNKLRYEDSAGEAKRKIAGPIQNGGISP